MLHAIARRIVRPDSPLRFSRVKFPGVVKCPPPVHHYIRQMPGSRNGERGQISGGFPGGGLLLELTHALWGTQGSGDMEADWLEELKRAIREVFPTEESFVLTE